MAQQSDGLSHRWRICALRAAQKQAIAACLRHFGGCTAVTDRLYCRAMDELGFHKMHSLGNDFVIVDRRAGKLSLSAAQIRMIADRRRGVGCDQLLALEPSQRAHLFMRVYNPDGSEAEACGNGTRCAAWLLMQELGRDHLLLETEAGLLDAERLPDGRVSVDMGQAKLDWRDIPLARATDTLHLDLTLGSLADPVAVNIGNPHCVFFVPDAEAIDIATLGPRIERDPLFPARGHDAVQGADRRFELRRQPFGEILRQRDDAQRLRRPLGVVAQQMRVVLDHRPAAGGIDDDRLDTGFDVRPPGGDVAFRVVQRAVLVIQVVADRATAAGTRLDQRLDGDPVEHPRHQRLVDGAAVELLEAGAVAVRDHVGELGRIGRVGIEVTRPRATQAGEEG